MDIKITNAAVAPRRYFALHMVEGLAEYKNIKHEGEEPFRVYLSEDVLKKMDQTFSGCPLYVGHVDSVDLSRLQEQADGYVVKSFYNRVDGKHWAEILVVSDRGHEAISKGWAVSNAYVPTMFGNSGVWHAMPYAKEVLDGKYEHLAIVPDPRYQESVILTPEDFKNYNERKEAELVSLQNSINEVVAQPKKTTSKGVVSMFKLWNRSEVEKAAEVVQMSITLPRSGREVTIYQLANEMDEVEMKKKDEDKDQKSNDTDGSDDALMNDDSMVEVEGEKMKLSDLKKKYNDLKTAGVKQNSEDLNKPEPLATKSQDVQTTTETTKNSIETLKNASETFHNEASTAVIAFDSTSTGRARYGSN